MRNPILIICSIFLFGCIGTQERISDETINKIAECTGGAGGIAGVKGEIEAKIVKEKKSGKVDAEIKYEEIIHGVIFSDNDISEDLKKFYFKEYQACLDKLRLAKVSTEQSSGSLKIESLEFLVDPGGTDKKPEIKLKHPSVYSQDSSDRIMFITKIGGYKFRSNGNIDIVYWTNIENKEQQLMVQGKKIYRINPNEWELKTKELGISKLDIESVTGAINMNVNTVLSNTIELESKLSKGEYDLVFYIKDNLSNAISSHKIPFLVE